jgi:O-antigen ligase
VVVTALLQSCVVLIQFFGLGLGFYEGLEGKWRVFGTFGNPNYVAEFLFPAVFLSLNLFLTESRKLQRRFYMLAVLMPSLAVFATFSVPAVALAAGIVCISFFYNGREKGGLRQTIAAVLRHGKTMLTVLISGLILIYIIVPVFRFDQTLMRHVANKTSVLGRIFIWKNSVAATVAHLPLGAGMGGFPAAYAAAQTTISNTAPLSWTTDVWSSTPTTTCSSSWSNWGWGAFCWRSSSGG